MSLSNPQKFMKLAIKEADLAYWRGDLPIGALIIDLNNEEIVAQTGNRQSSVFDPTAHAEISAIRDACQKLQSTFLTHHAIVVSTEPCTMCISAIIKAKISEVYYGVSVKDLNKNGFNLIPIACEEIANKSPHKPEIVPNVLQAECLAQRLKYK